MVERPMEALESFRREIDATDAQVIELLGRRFDICRQVARLKREHRIPMMQHGRVAAVKERCMRLGVQSGLDPAFVADIYTLIIGQSCLLETEIIDRDPD